MGNEAKTTQQQQPAKQGAPLAGQTAQDVKTTADDPKGVDGDSRGPAPANLSGAKDEPVTNASQVNTSLHAVDGVRLVRMYHPDPPDGINYQNVHPSALNQHRRLGWKAIPSGGDFDPNAPIPSDHLVPGDPGYKAQKATVDPRSLPDRPA